MDDTKVLTELKYFVNSCGSQKEAAKSLGISTQYLNDLLRSRRNISEEIAGKFGYKAEWVRRGEPCI
jgi:plasmid maintenance system antidote protein VapI